MLKVVDYTEQDQVLERYMELKAKAAERKVKREAAFKRAFVLTGKMVLKDVLFLIFLLALAAAIVWVLWGTWIG